MSFDRRCREFGDEEPPAGDILAVKVENLDAKDALLAMELPGFFTIPHFNGYAAVLIALRTARTADVRAAIRAAWSTVAPAETPKKPTKRCRQALVAHTLVRWPASSTAIIPSASSGSSR